MRFELEYSLSVKKPIDGIRSLKSEIQMKLMDLYNDSHYSGKYTALILLILSLLLSNSDQNNNVLQRQWSTHGVKT